MAYVTTAEVKAELGITDSGRDAGITRAVNAASAAIDRSCSRSFVVPTTATDLIFSPDGRRYVEATGEGFIVEDIASTSGLVVAVGSGSTYTTITSSAYALNPPDAIARSRPATAIVMLGSTWAVGTGETVKVTARWGWPATPAEITEAAMILSIRLWKRKDSPEGVMGQADWGMMRVSRVDPDVEALIGPFRRGGFA